MSKGRIGWIDIAKCLGIFYVVLGHTFSEINVIQQILYLFHVPLFFFLSGLTYHYVKNQLKFIESKIRRLYLPYLAVAVISIFVYQLFGRLVGSDPGSLISNFTGMLYGNVSAGNMMWNRPLWFLLALFVVLIIMNLLEAVPNRILRYSLLALLTIAGYTLSYYQIFLPLQTETALSMLIWVYLGYILKPTLLKMETWKKSYLFLMMVVLIVIGLFVGRYNGTISVMVDLYGRNVFLYFVAAFCLSMVTVIISILIGHSKVLEYVGRNTLPILLWHKFPIEFAQGVLPGVKQWLISPNIIVVDVTTIAVALIAIVLSLIVHICIVWFFGKFKIKV